MLKHSVPVIPSAAMAPPSVWLHWTFNVGMLWRGGCRAQEHNRAVACFSSGDSLISRRNNCVFRTLPPRLTTLLTCLVDALRAGASRLLMV